ncbi:hypothetical protein AVEN_39825-1 [Araneus ventricosus]|uniref:Uncharacterized protein n=1 Tax=Araneus ventricosus TaxID=182803 RepID=A0A4Y2PI88_ARAVE|nr:hypothetical protein AVEN_39825-1 [Araneus ventricosus]
MYRHIKESVKKIFTPTYKFDTFPNLQKPFEPLEVVWIPCLHGDEHRKSPMYFRIMYFKLYLNAYHLSARSGLRFEVSLQINLTLQNAGKFNTFPRFQSTSASSGRSPDLPTKRNPTWKKCKSGTKNPHETPLFPFPRETKAISL